MNQKKTKPKNPRKHQKNPKNQPNKQNPQKGKNNFLLQKLHDGSWNSILHSDAETSVTTSKPQKHRDPSASARKSCATSAAFFPHRWNVKSLQTATKACWLQTSLVTQRSRAVSGQLRVHPFFPPEGTKSKRGQLGEPGAAGAIAFSSLGEISAAAERPAFCGLSYFLILFYSFPRVPWLSCNIWNL